MKGGSEALLLAKPVPNSASSSHVASSRWSISVCWPAMKRRAARVPCLCAASPEPCLWADGGTATAGAAAGAAAEAAAE